MTAKLLKTDASERTPSEVKSSYLRLELIALSVVIAVLAIIFLSPFYLVIVNSLKDYGDVLRGAASFPRPLVFENYKVAWTTVQFPLATFNSLIITIVSITLLVLLGAMAAWRLARAPHRVNNLIFTLFVAAMVVPFQSVMIPLMRVGSALNLLDNRPGLIIIYLGFGMPFTVFLFHGFIKASVPREIEEAAIIDGCNSFQTFFLVVLPILRPMLATVVILHAFWIWNDFLLPLLVLYDPAKRTIPLAVFSFLGKYTDRWNLALATLTMGMLPIIVFFLALQKYIIRGVAAGSVKR
jgi:raffinose/stachyose/melibiose transport system permease protein